MSLNKVSVDDINVKGKRVRSEERRVGKEC